jgi:8-oxo-dGTP pyrophosphatase MutT (NUDIX family)
MKKEKSCGAIIIENGKTLLVQEAEGHWGFPKGHVEANETEEETAIREVKEETNLDVKIQKDKRYEISYIVNDDSKKTVILFGAKKIGGTESRQEEEINQIKWCSFDEALEIITYDNVKEVFREFLKDL